MSSVVLTCCTGIDDLYAAVDSIFWMIRIEQLRFAVSRGGKSLGCDAELGNHIITDRFGAPLREFLVEVGAAFCICVASDDKAECSQPRVAQCGA